MRKSIADLARKSIQDLEKEVYTFKQEIKKLMIEKKVKSQKDTNMISKKRRRVAQMQSVLQEKRLFEAVKPKTGGAK